MAYILHTCSWCGKPAKFTIIQVINQLAECTLMYCQCNLCKKGEVIIIKNPPDNSPKNVYPKGEEIIDNVPQTHQTEKAPP